MGLFGVLVLAAPRISAAVEPEMARERSQGHTSRGDLGSLSAILRAPATLHLRSRYDAGADFSMGPDRLRRFHVAALDSQTGPVAAGLSFGREVSRPTVRTEDLPGWKRPDQKFNDLRDAQIRLGGGMGFSVLNRTLGFGGSVEWNQRTNGFDESESAVSGGASIAAYLGEQVVLSVTGERLIPTGLWFAPTQIGSGFRWQASPAAALSADVVTDLTSHASAEVGFGVGASFMAGDLVPLRMGFARDAATLDDRLTAGVGVANRQAEFSYAFELPVGASVEADTAGIAQAEHTIALVLSF
ncbi:MAG: hypothetical protein CL927_05310 [Deltaproteobacteria bacterium]|nr:hypothetical protein [Deltaproteobacteria bacterium]HCH66376.1 hypothetical protein [Deltaproteobacteria bacterium]